MRVTEGHERVGPRVWERGHVNAAHGNSKGRAPEDRGEAGPGSPVWSVQPECLRPGVLACADLRGV